MNCAYCRRRACMVTACMVGLDARNEQPRLVATFTTRDQVEAGTIREAMAQIVRKARVIYPELQYCGFVEFTTGKGPRSGGMRRPHLHVLLKRVPPEGAAAVRAIAVEVLDRLARAYRHEVEEIRTPAGATMYVARHHLKESQSPPPGWERLRRVRPSRGYWSRPATQLRRRANAIVAEERFVSAVQRRLASDVPDGFPLDIFYELLDDRLAKQRRTGELEVVRVREKEETDAASGEVRTWVLEVLGCVEPQPADRVKFALGAP